MLAAPAFAGAAAFAIVWDPDPPSSPTIVGVAALAAAVAAAVARALARTRGGAAGLDRRRDGVFVVTGGAALAGRTPAVVWSVLLLVAMLAARFVPMLAVDVPDQFLIDLERLAVTAWSARERPKGRRGRTVVPGARSPMVAAGYPDGDRRLRRRRRCRRRRSAAARRGTLPMDRIGARCLVFFAGAALLLAARSYRHVAARALLRTAGLVCWAVADGRAVRRRRTA